MSVIPDHDTEASWLEPPGPKYSWAFQDRRVQSMDTQARIISRGSDHELSGDLDADAYSLYGQTCSTFLQVSEASDEAMSLDLPNASAYTAPLSTNALDTRLH